MRGLAIFSLLKPLTRFLERKMAFLFAFANRHFTPLAVVVIILCGTIFFFVSEYLFRYSHWNWWLWKSRAVTKTIYFGTVIIALKILLGVM